MCFKNYFVLFYLDFINISMHNLSIHVWMQSGLAMDTRKTNMWLGRQWMSIPVGNCFISLTTTYLNFIFIFVEQLKKSWYEVQMKCGLKLKTKERMGKQPEICLPGVVENWEPILGAIPVLMELVLTFVHEVHCPVCISLLSPSCGCPCSAFVYGK